MRFGKRRAELQGVGDSFAALLESAKAGDSRAASILYDNHVAMVYGYLRACGVVEVEDLASEVFVGMLRSLNRFTGDHPDFRRWLMTIAHRRLVDYRRRQSSKSVHYVDPAILEAESTAHTSDPFPVVLDPRLIAGFAHLTEAQREVLALRFVADTSLDDVAAITNRPIGAVKSIQHRALNALRKHLAGADAQLGRRA